MHLRCRSWARPFRGSRGCEGAAKRLRVLRSSLGARRSCITLRPSAVYAGDSLAVFRLPRPLQGLSPTPYTLTYNSSIDIDLLMLDTRSFDR